MWKYDAIFEPGVIGVGVVVVSDARESSRRSARVTDRSDVFIREVRQTPGCSACVTYV